MKFDLKSAVAGLLLGIGIMALFGFIGENGYEKKSQVTIGEAANLVLVRDENNNAVVINMKTGKADWVTYVTTNPPSTNLVKLLK